MIEFGETDEPTASGGIQIRHAECKRIEFPIAEDGAFDFGKFGSAFRPRRRAGHPRRPHAGHPVGVDGLGRDGVGCGLLPRRGRGFRHWASHIKTCGNIIASLPIGATSSFSAAVATCSGSAISGVNTRQARSSGVSFGRSREGAAAVSRWRVGWRAHGGMQAQRQEVAAPSNVSGSC